MLCLYQKNEHCLGTFKIGDLVYCLPQMKYLSLPSNLLSFFLLSPIKTPRLMSQATAFNHFNAYIFTVLLTDRRADEAWEPPFSPCSKASDTSSMTLNFHLLFYYILYLFVSNEQNYIKRQSWDDRRVGGWSELAASLRGPEPGSKGASITRRYLAAQWRPWLRTLVFMWQSCCLKTPLNLIKKNWREVRAAVGNVLDLCLACAGFEHRSVH
jgi:hypothetical protein